MANEIKLLGYNNPYWKNNPRLFLKLSQIVSENPKNYPSIVLQNGWYSRGKYRSPIYRKDKDNSALLFWIESMRPQLKNPFYKVQTKVFWIIHGLVDFPKCIYCGKSDKFMQVNVGCKGYFEACSVDCSNKNKEKKQKYARTCLDRYGVKHYSMTSKYKIQYRQTCLDHFGTTSNLACESQKALIRQTNLKTYGVECLLQSEKFHQDSKLAKKQKYGDENFNNRPKFNQTCIDRYGVPFPQTLQEFKDKTRITVNDLYGVDFPLQNHEIFVKSRSKYSYIDIHFDSAPEVALYIWLRDHQIQFEYQPDISFEYEFNGRKFRYFPDFKIGSQLVEIKGDHFFSEDGKMICPYRKKSWSDEKYQEECAKYEAKHQCMLANGIQIWTSKKYDFYLQYVKSTYGSNFLQSLKQYYKNNEK